ncbi:SGNH/GDSL hydrolase family protein [Pseudonocardia kujensis]|uniref:SGNH/GDSL hydrolase family protein n=1 Tax=Pseudonocardia kujensis TaxID=1128675 RepID=UPI001E486B36|nr:SGNH/GDSL hydrolase family protein [Pseudonocardia kujensis]MCE0766695.1 SGNH/GDSL hydrolase family protein [Pseudonocardia kujensis]
MRGWVGGLRWRVPLQLTAMLVAGLVVAGIPADEGGTPPGVRTAGEGAGPKAALRVMPLGASSTEGVGSPGTAGYRGPLFAELTGDGIRVDYVGSRHDGPAGMADPDNEGHSGWTLAKMIPAVGAWVAEADPDVVLLHMGTNDVNSGAKGGVAAARLDTLLDKVFAAAPQTHVIVAGIWAPLSAHAKDRAELARLTPGVVARHRALGHSVEFVDTSTLLAPGDFADGLHANAGGYRKIAAMWTTEIEGWLAQRRAAPVEPVGPAGR